MKRNAALLALLLVGCTHVNVTLRDRIKEPPPPVAIPHGVLWTDGIQSACEAPWGFSQIQLERPIGQAVQGNAEVNMTRVPAPGGDGFALKQIATFDNNGGSRSQAGIYSFANSTFSQLVQSPNGVYIAQEWFFPEAITANSGLDTNPWVNLWDFHSVGPGSRWDTQPGLMLAEDGSMRVKWSWHEHNHETDWSSVSLPVGEWFDVEMHYVWSESANGGSSCEPGGGTTVTLWVNGQKVLEQSGVITKGSGHDSVETYMKFYGSASGGNDWHPMPSVKYFRNVRMAGERIWR